MCITFLRAFSRNVVLQSCNADRFLSCYHGDNTAIAMLTITSSKLPQQNHYYAGMLLYAWLQQCAVEHLRTLYTYLWPRVSRCRLVEEDVRNERIHFHEQQNAPYHNTMIWVRELTILCEASCINDLAIGDNGFLVICFPHCKTFAICCMQI